MLVPLAIPGAFELFIVLFNLLGLVAVAGGVLYFLDRARSGSSPDERFDRAEREIGGIQARVDDLDDRVTELERLRDRVEELERMVAQGEDRD